MNDFAASHRRMIRAPHPWPGDIAFGLESIRLYATEVVPEVRWILADAPG